MLMPFILGAPKLSDTCSSGTDYLSPELQLINHLPFRPQNTSSIAALINTQDWGFYSDLGFQCFPLPNLFLYRLTSFYTLACVSKHPVPDTHPPCTLRLPYVDTFPILRVRLEQQPIKKPLRTWPGAPASSSCTENED